MTNDQTGADRDYAAVLDRTLGRLELIDRHHSPAVLASAFGLESMVMTDLIHRRRLGIEIVSIDTGRLPRETHDLAHRVHHRYGPIVRMVTPDPADVGDWVAQNGPNGFYDSVEARRSCSEIRKVAPLRRVLEGKAAWLSGLRREHSTARADVSESEFDNNYGLTKFNPMVDWTTTQVWSYIHEHEVPYNSLHDQGYASIGCAPCTRAIAPGEDMRAGRWWWEQEGNSECGLHQDPESGRLLPVSRHPGGRDQLNGGAG